MFRELHRHIHQIVQRLRNMANNSNNKNLDAETSKLFIDSDASRGMDAFETASLAIPQTARPGVTSPLERTFVEEQGQGSSSSRFVPTPRPGPKAGKSQAEAQPHAPREAWICCGCHATNPFVGPACWQCKAHWACNRCYCA